MPRLSVCIPTYNRASVLAERLKRMAAMQDKLEIEIVLSDNASTDHTRDVAEQFRSSFASFHYTRQTRLISPVLNFYAVLRNVTFDHLLVMGDDDCIIADNVVNALAFFDREPRLQALIGNQERFNFDTEMSEGIIPHVTASERHDITTAAALFAKSYFYEYVIARREPLQRYFYNEGLSYPLGWKMLHCCLREGTIALEPPALIYKDNDPSRLGQRNYLIQLQDFARSDSEYFAALTLPQTLPENREALYHAMRMRTVRYSSDARLTAHAQGKALIALHYAQKAAIYDYDTTDYPTLDPSTVLFERLAYWLAEMFRASGTQEIAIQECSAAPILAQQLKALVPHASLLSLPLTALPETDVARIAVSLEYDAATAARAAVQPSLQYCALDDLLWSCLEKPSDYAGMKALLG